MINKHFRGRLDRQRTIRQIIYFPAGVRTLGIHYCLEGVSIIHKASYRQISPNLEGNLGKSLVIGGLGSSLSTNIIKRFTSYYPFMYSDVMWHSARKSANVNLMSRYNTIQYNNVLQHDTIWPGMILCMRPANERRRYIVASSPVSWAHTQNDPWISFLRYCQGTGK